MIDPSPPAPGKNATRRIGNVLGTRSNWEQLAKFCVVGATGYVVNLAVYYLLLRQAGVHYIPAAVCSFAVAVSNNYVLNRAWTFRVERGNVGAQGWRFFVVSTVSLAANIGLLTVMVAAGTNELAAQAVAIVLVTPLNFVGNKLWSFRPR
ncbi:MAG: GtrA family protein [Thermoleophilia bacterium]|nr:GtrA family protein [Thermoleophilia bacterium]